MVRFPDPRIGPTRFSLEELDTRVQDNESPEDFWNLVSHFHGPHFSLSSSLGRAAGKHSFVMPDEDLEPQVHMGAVVNLQLPV